MKEHDYKTLTGDTLWNLGSLLVMAVAGVTINVMIAKHYGPAILGVFNQVFAVYVVASQFAVGGLSFSTVKFVSDHSSQTEKVSGILTAALGCAMVSIGGVVLLLFFFKEWIGAVLTSPAVTRGILCILPGLGCFALNKIMLAAINGLEKMKVFALMLALRYAIIVAAVIALCFRKVPGEILPVSFSIAETILLFGLGIYLFGLQRLRLVLGPRRAWFRNHVVFALKAFPGGLLTDLNTRVDVLMLGLFLGDRSVGIYSFAAFFAEGFLQIPHAVRVSVNPRLSRLAAAGRFHDLAQVIHDVRSRVWVFSSLAGVALIVLFPLLPKFVRADESFFASAVVFNILMIGAILVSGYIPFQTLLSQVHAPGAFTLFMFCQVLVNVLLNLILIPEGGVYGAALATAVSWILSIFFLKAIAAKTIKISL